MPKTRKNRNSRKRRGGVHPHGNVPYDNKGNPLPAPPNNRLSRVATPPRSPMAPNYGAPPPSPPPLVRGARAYDRSAQQDLSSSDGSSISSSGSSEGSYASSLTSDEDVYEGMSDSLRNWYAIMGDAAAPPRRRSGTPRRLNLGSGLLKRKSRKNRKMRKNKKSRRSRKNKRVVRKTRRQSRKHRR